MYEFSSLSFFPYSLLFFSLFKFLNLISQNSTFFFFFFVVANAHILLLFFLISDAYILYY